MHSISDSTIIFSCCDIVSQMHKIWQFSKCNGFSELCQLRQTARIQSVANIKLAENYEKVWPVTPCTDINRFNVYAKSLVVFSVANTVCSEIVPAAFGYSINLVVWMYFVRLMSLQYNSDVHRKRAAQFDELYAEGNLLLKMATYCPVPQEINLEPGAAVTIGPYMPMITEERFDDKMDELNIKLAALPLENATSAREQLEQELHDDMNACESTVYKMQEDNFARS